MEKSSNKQSSLEKLKYKKDVINARIRKMEALEKNKERKRDTRRKILLGSYYMDLARKQNDNYSMADVNALMADFLKRDSDRVLFDLPLLNEKSKNKDSAEEDETTRMENNKEEAEMNS